jgi:hypothetical protein
VTLIYGSEDLARLGLITRRCVSALKTAFLQGSAGCLHPTRGLLVEQLQCLLPVGPTHLAV